MATPKSARDPQNNRIPLVYRFFFLWFESLCAFNGALLSEFAPFTYLVTLTPVGTPQFSPQSSPIPVEMMLLRQAASFMLVFAFTEIVVLRAVGEQRRDIWRLMMTSMLISDVGWLYAAWGIAQAAGGVEPQRFWFWNAWMWNRKEEWGNLGMTWLPFFVRLSFILASARD